MSLRILHLSYDDVTGGAARCAFRLHVGLRRLGHDSHMLVARRRSADPTIVAHRPARDLYSRLRRRLRKRRIASELRRYRGSRPATAGTFSDDRTAHALDSIDVRDGWDVINLHWIAGLVDPRNLLSWLRHGARVVWTLHDMNALTGGCHYTNGCRRFSERCGACPQLGSRDARDLSRQIWTRKRQVLSRTPPESLHIVTPSRWLAREVERSSLLGGRFAVSVIPYGVDTADFAPRARSATRAALGIPQTARVVLFAAHALDDHRKGFSLLADALDSIIGMPDLFLLSIGKRKPTIQTSIPHRHIAFADDERLLSLVYSAADVYVLPSRQDNLPATVLEAMACGTPVVAFRVGGVAELVRPAVTGWLAAPADVQGLAAAIIRTLSDERTRTELAATCRRVAIEEYGLSEQARRYAALYARLIGDPTRSGAGDESGRRAVSVASPALVTSAGEEDELDGWDESEVW